MKPRVFMPFVMRRARAHSGHAELDAKVNDFSAGATIASPGV